MATLGKTTSGGTAENWPANYVLISGPYVAIENGTINDVQLRVSTSGGASQVMRGVVYEGASGSTAALVATSSEITVAAFQTPAWYTCPISSGSIISGHSYWVGRETGTNQSEILLAGGSSGDSYYIANTYPTAPATMTGATAYTDMIDAYLDYTPGGVAVFKTAISSLHPFTPLRAATR